MSIQDLEIYGRPYWEYRPATAPTGSGRVFWAPDLPLGGLGLAFVLGGVLGFIAGKWWAEAGTTAKTE